MKIGYFTDKGMRRQKNEDAIKVLGDQRLFMLADGVGGNKSGEMASKTALEALENFVHHNPLDKLDGRDEVFRYFETAVDYVNQVILKLSDSQPKYAGMATTLVFAYIAGKLMYIANVGDSRVYLLHNSEIHQITEDHTYVNDLVRMGAISKSEAENHNKKNVITRAIGANACNTPDCFNVYVEPGDKVLICSDGLYDEVNEKEILHKMLLEEDMRECAKNLVDMANEHGGSDNISVICIGLEED